MPDDNRFAGLSDAMDGEEEPDDTSAADSTAADAESSSPEQGGASGEGTDEETPVDPRERPAFSFEETTPKSIYVREETLTVLEDTEFDVEAILRQEHDVRNVTGREFHDAAVRVLADHADEVAERVLADRTDDA